MKKEHQARLMEDAQSVALAVALLKNILDGFLRDMREMIEYDNGNGKGGTDDDGEEK